MTRRLTPASATITAPPATACGHAVALLDVRMPRLDGLAMLARLRAAGSPVRVLLISGGDDSEVAHEAITKGAAGFLSKDAEESEIAEAILAVAEGHSVLSKTLQSGVLDLMRARVQGTRASRASP